MKPSTEICNPVEIYEPEIYWAFGPSHRLTRSVSADFMNFAFIKFNCEAIVEVMHISVYALPMMQVCVRCRNSVCHIWRPRSVPMCPTSRATLAGTARHASVGSPPVYRTLRGVLVLRRFRDTSHPPRSFNDPNCCVSGNNLLFCSSRLNTLVLPLISIFYLLWLKRRKLYNLHVYLICRSIKSYSEIKVTFY